MRDVAVSGRRKLPGENAVNALVNVIVQPRILAKRGSEFIGAMCLYGPLNDTFYQKLTPLLELLPFAGCVSRESADELSIFVTIWNSRSKVGIREADESNKLCHL